MARRRVGVRRSPLWGVVSCGGLSLLLGACGPEMSGNDASMMGRDATTSGPEAGGEDAHVHGETGPGETGTGGDSGMMAACGASLGPCNPVTNMGCMSGEACVFAQDEMMRQTTACVRAGTGGPGTPCTMVTDCREGLACVGASGSSTCQRLCCGEGDDERCRTGPSGQAGSRCGGQLAETGLHICQVPARCDVFSQNCPSGRACVVVAADGTTDCIAAGTPMAGQACGGSGGMNCASGNVCLVQMGSSQGMCYRYCEPMAATGSARGCPTGSACTRAPMLLPDTVGVCVPQMM